MQVCGSCLSLCLRSLIFGFFCRIITLTTALNVHILTSNPSSNHISPIFRSEGYFCDIQVMHINVNEFGGYFNAMDAFLGPSLDWNASQALKSWEFLCMHVCLFCCKLQALFNWVHSNQVKTYRVYSSSILHLKLIR